MQLFDPATSKILAAGENQKSGQDRDCSRLLNASGYAGFILIGFAYATAELIE
jgi:hypothetical protein